MERCSISSPKSTNWTIESPSRITYSAQVCWFFWTENCGCKQMRVSVKQQKLNKYSLMLLLKQKCEIFVGWRIFFHFVSCVGRTKYHF